MTEQAFSKLCKAHVAAYTNMQLNRADGRSYKPLVADDVFIVWQCKILQNNKALLSTPLPDGMYYELTYNGDTHELYFDAYKKTENRCIKVKEDTNGKSTAM